MKEKYTFPEKEIPDLYLPDYVKFLGFFCFFLALVCVACAVFLREAWWVFVVFAVLLVPIGIAALLCHKNQMAVLTADTLYYRTFLGNVYRLRLSQLQRVRKNADSVTLFFPEKKVHVEAMAILSPEMSKLVGRDGIKPTGSQ